MKITKLRKLGIIVGSVVLLWFVFFEWHFVPFPLDSDYGGPATCYSPNHEYYVERYQTPVSALVFLLFPNLSPSPKGIAILYDKTGKKIYSDYSIVYASQEDGPYWSINSVFFGDDWHVRLPSSPGGFPASPYGNSGCFDERSDYVIPPPPSALRRELIIKSVEPLENSNAPYQLQFLFEDQNNTPFTSFHYLIIRADGSRQYGKTDGEGRTVAIESEVEESVVLFHPPMQDIEGFDSPESLTKCVKTEYTVCFDPKTYTVTANTIKVEPTNSKGDF